MTNETLANCAFQFATNTQNILFDTDSITKAEADKLFDENIEKFKELMDDDQEPEMVVWVNMKDSTSYGDTGRHWRADDMVVIDGRLFQAV